MTVGVGDDVAYAATPEQSREATGWHSRFIVAFGGAVVVVSILLLGSAWTEGLRGSTFAQLRSDIASGSVQEWYVADSLSQGDFDLMEAHQSQLHSEEVAENGEVSSSSTSTTGPGEPTGGILVWRMWGSQGWQVAASDNDPGSFGGMSVDANEQSKALVAALREAGVSMRPNDFSDNMTLQNFAAFGALLVLAGLLFGAAPRVGTRWFWFWMFLNGPFALGFIAYAAMELIGFRRRPDPPLKKRLPGVVGFVGALVLSFALAAGAEFLRRQGVPLPL
ncbi:hypothetical protein V6K52_17070 [Knoellia sp. S7-12]|uniref:hypothetical protein n=1 Tax=Knoellia sp. S7-12 TaxID=3126698 RepID=UPI003369690B